MRETQPNPSEKQQKRKPFFISYGIVILVMLLLNAFLFPALLGNQVQSVDYGTFLNMLEEGKLTTVQLEEEQIYFADKEEKMYSTNAIPQDYTIVERLGGYLSRNSEDGAFTTEILLPIGNSSPTENDSSPE